MNKESAFSSEYDISDKTEPKSSIQEKSSTTQVNELDEFTKIIEANYNLSKPRRKLILARIIKK